MQHQRGNPERRLLQLVQVKVCKIVKVVKVFCGCPRLHYSWHCCWLAETGTKAIWHHWQIIHMV